LLLSKLSGTIIKDTCVQFILLGINHRTASLDVRERFAFSGDDLAWALSACKNTSIIEECVILSTCNRTEIYALTPHLEQTREFLLQTLCQYAALSVSDFEDIAYTSYNKFAAQHLFQVAAGLDSMVFGENEILRQVKDALLDAQLAESSGAVLNQLFTSAIRAGKRVRSETAINQGAASIGSVAARLIRDYAQVLKREPRILLIGTGKMGAVTLKNLEQTAFPLTLSNRSRAKADDLAASYSGAQVIDLSEMPVALAESDVVITCTSADHFLIDYDHRAAFAQRTDPVLLIDLSVPRNMEPRLAEIENVSYYDMDRLQQVVERSYENRMLCQDLAETILADEMARFLEWFNTREVIPTIQALYDVFSDIRQREMERGLKKYQGEVSAEVQDLLDRVTRAITQKILHYPVVQLKVEHSPERKQQYAEVLSALFKLDAQDSIDRYVHTEPSQKNVQAVQKPAPSHE
jgi:glutamyl-tRNA reductase